MEVDDLLSREIDRLRSPYPHADISTMIEEQVGALADERILSVFANLPANAVRHDDLRARAST